MLGVNPADAAAVLKLLLGVWDAAAERLLATVASRLARGVTRPGWAESKLAETLALRAELDGIVRQAVAATPELAARAWAEAYELGGRTVDATGGPIISRPEVVQTLAARMVDTVQGAHLPVVSAHVNLFRRATQEAELAVATGTVTRQQAVAQGVDRLLAEGVDRFPDRSGRRWHLDTYVRMAGRTMAAQAAVQGELDSLADQGRDLVIISDSPRECGTCRPWEGRLLSISAANVGRIVDKRRVSGTVAEARAAGLWHPNCTHRADPYVPGLTRKPAAKANPKGYAAQQRQRELERGLRELKRRRMVAEQIGDRATQRQLNVTIREAGRVLKEHITKHGLMRRPDRERPVGG